MWLQSYEGGWQTSLADIGNDLQGGRHIKPPQNPSYELQVMDYMHVGTS